MAFIQIIDARTSDVDALRAMDADWRKATEGRRTARRTIVTTDRNDPDRHLVIVFFDSYESAMENSALPETQQFAQRWNDITTVAPVFVDLDVIEDHHL